MGERKQTNLHLDQDLVLLAREKLRECLGKDNLSELVNRFLGDFVEADDSVNPVRQQVRELMVRKRKYYLAQKKIIADSEAAQEEARGYQQKRQAAVEQACVTTFLKYRDFARCLPENDVDFDHIDQFHLTVDEISRLAGYEVDTREVIAIYHQKAGTRAVGSRETGETAYGVREVP